jgi:hypothetical protein
MHMRPIITLCLTLSIAPVVHAQPVRFMLHGNMSHELPTEEYLRFVEEVNPDILIMGVFDQRLYSLASASKAKQAGIDPMEHLLRWKRVADRLHRKGIRLIGQMELFVVSDQPKELDNGEGWFGYYSKHWNPKLLGERPTENVRDLLAHSDGNHLKEDKLALCGCRVNTKAILGCVNNPQWAEMQKRMIKAAVEHGVDGFMTNRNFFEHCDCPHCQESFRRWLGARFEAVELKSRFNIVNLATHSFACVTGTYRIHETTPDALHLEKLRFTKDRVRQFFDEVYIKYGRSIKKDLFTAQWNHMAYFDELHLDKGHLPPSTRTNFAHAFADERWGVSAKDWGRGEDLLWYCNWGTTQNTILAEEYAGDTVLYGLYLSAMARGKSYVINKYDYYRPRIMMAEAAALGYATNALATPWQHEEDREIVLRYFRFLRKHVDLFADTERLAEIGLVFPRRAIHAGDAAPLEYTEACGRTLIREHFLFNMIPDDLLAQTPLDGYRALIIAAPEYLELDEVAALQAFTRRGGQLIWTHVNAEDRARPGASSVAARHSMRDVKLTANRVENVRMKRHLLINAIGKRESWSQAAAPWTVEVHGYRQAAKKRWILHLVNYNHKENAPGKSVSAREAPIEAAPVEVRLNVPGDTKIRRVRFLSPDRADEVVVPFRAELGLLQCRTPGFLAYGICVVEAE